MGKKGLELSVVRAARGPAKPRMLDPTNVVSQKTHRNVSSTIPEDIVPQSVRESAREISSRSPVMVDSIRTRLSWTVVCAAVGMSPIKLKVNSKLDIGVGAAVAVVGATVVEVGDAVVEVGAAVADVGAEVTTNTRVGRGVASTCDVGDAV